MDIAEIIRYVAVNLQSEMAETDDQMDAHMFGENARVGPLEGGTYRRWFVVRHQTDDAPAIRITVEVED